MMMSLHEVQKTKGSIQPFEWLESNHPSSLGHQQRTLGDNSCPGNQELQRKEKTSELR
jgi:hypothetical protein